MHIICPFAVSLPSTPARLGPLGACSLSGPGSLVVGLMTCGRQEAPEESWKALGRKVPSGVLSLAFRHFQKEGVSSSLVLQWQLLGWLQQLSSQ